MTAGPSLSWGWQPDRAPPPAEAAVAWHEAAGRLHARLLQLAPAVQSCLMACAGRQVLVVMGETPHLPWVPGIAYAVRCPGAPALWRPTLSAPDVPVELLARALLRRHERSPLLLWPAPAAVVPLDRQYPVSAPLLARIAAHWQAA